MTKTIYNSIKHHLHREKKRLQLTMSGLALSLRFQVESHTGCMYTEGGKLN